MNQTLLPAAHDRQRALPKAKTHREKCAAGAGRPSLGLRPRSVRPAPAQSHPDCRCRLILIVARQSLAARGDLGCNGESRGPAALPTAMRCGERTAAISPPRLASLGSGPDRPLLGLFTSSSGTLGIWDGQHEAHFARRGPIGQLFFAAALIAAQASCSAGRSADSQ